MADKKAPAKKAAKKTAQKAAPKRNPKAKNQQILVLRTESVSLRELNVYHKNPNVGNVDLIAKSLHLNGLFRPIVVNIGTYTGRPNEILAGNHTYLAARKPLFWQVKSKVKGEPPATYDKPAWDDILCSFVDVDDVRAAQIVAVDNKAAAEGKIDDEALFKMFDGLPDEFDLEGAGFKGEEWDQLAEQFTVVDIPEDDAPILINDDDDDDDEPGSKAPSPKFDDVPLGDEAEAEDDAPSVTSRSKKDEGDEEDPDDPEGAGIEILDVDEEIKGAFVLKGDAYFAGTGYYNIPKLRKDMLAEPEDIPENLTTWAGSATKYDDDPDTYWLYNFGVDSTAGMKDISKVIVSFYTYDEYFEPWWFAPDRYVGKMINSKVKYALTPDFTDDLNHGRAYCLWQLFRARWLGRYMQEAGMKLIPNISWPDGDIDYLKDITLATLPKGIPVIAMQMQTFGKNMEDDHKDRLAAELQLVMDTIKPKLLLLYSGQPGYEFFMDRVKTKADIRFLLNRQAKLSASRKGRKRKDTL